MVEVIDTKIFSINKNVKITEKFIGKSNNKIIIADNFFMFPNHVRQYALSCSYVKEGGHANPGYIHRTGINTFEFLNFTNWLKEYYFKDPRENYNAPIFSFQAYDKIGSILPHIDEVNYAGLCCLNTDEEIFNDISGTSFYEYKTGEEHSHAHSYRTQILDSSKLEDWNKYHTEYHQYNRFIFYESCLFHSAYWDENKWTSDNPRLTFNTFTW
jgi:hypothetical protein